jgi:hypothetical protein
MLSLDLRKSYFILSLTFKVNIYWLIQNENLKICISYALWMLGMYPFTLVISLKGWKIIGDIFLGMTNIPTSQVTLEPFLSYNIIFR